MSRISLSPLLPFFLGSVASFGFLLHQTNIHANSIAVRKISNFVQSKPINKNLKSSSPDGSSENSLLFSLNLFGDSAWAMSHEGNPTYKGSYKKAFLAFSKNENFMGDLNYVNWETSIGTRCDKFWSDPSPSTYAFITRPEELRDAINLGFNLVGMANNHSFDCIRSSEGDGPLQSYNHIQNLKKAFLATGKSVLFSGVHNTLDQEAPSTLFPVTGGFVPVRFISAYVGGDVGHCRYILCDANLNNFKLSMSTQNGLRVLALHSWDKNSHMKLDSILRDWLKKGYVDVAVGTGPHVAQSVSVVATPRGTGVLATSLGNFIHPSLSRQPNNIELKTEWSYDQKERRLRLVSLRTIAISCDGSVCTKVGSMSFKLK